MTTVLSIIIPTFKRRESLQRLLRALEVQENISPEIIVVDQNDPSVLDDILPAFPSVRRLMMETPNASDARNRGFLASKGQFLLFIDDDLVPGPQFCAKGVEIFNRYASIGCFSPLVYNDLGKEPALQAAAQKKISVLREESSIFSITDTISAALFFRKEYFATTGGFDPVLFEFAKTAEDFEFFQRIGKKKMDAYFVPFIEVYHDESVPGGCELRSADYWRTREKCIRSWVFCRRIHHTPLGRLSVNDLLSLSRSSFLNKEVVRAGIRDIYRQAGILLKALHSSRDYLQVRDKYYVGVSSMDHLTKTID